MTEDKNEMSKKAQRLTQKFESYLEKYRIVELFQELTTMLLIKKPEDHVLFLKQSLCHAAHRLDAPRIIILASSDFDQQHLAEILQNKLNIPIVSLNDIVDDSELKDADAITDKLRKILINNMKINCDGWIFLGFPRTVKEALCIQRMGIIPTHVIDIISSNKRFPLTTSVNNKIDINYYEELEELRDIFSSFLMKIYINERKIEDIAEECLDIVKYRNYFQGRIKYRILLIDYQDSTRSKCLGQHISETFNVMHIDFCEALEKICLCETDLGDELKKVKEKKNLKNVCTKIKMKALEYLLRKYENVRKGWILTGFFTTMDDFKNLDVTDSSPNRVLVIVPKNYGDTEHFNLHSKKDSVKSLCDCEEETISLSDETIKEIMDYASESANVIQEHDDLSVLKEKIELILLAPRPCVPPRIPREPPRRKIENIEFDPDDEPCIHLFDKIRKSEPELQLL